MPVVLAPRRIPRSQIRPQAGLAVPRGGLGPRAEDCHKLDPRRWPEHPIPTLLRWAHSWLKYLGKPLWVVVDGVYAKAPFLKPAMSLGMTVVSRLCKDAALWTVPGPRVAGRRGRPRIYGENRIDLAKRAGQRRGWTTEVFELYGKRVKKRYKTFVATWCPKRRHDPCRAGGRAGRVGGLLLTGRREVFFSQRVHYRIQHGRSSRHMHVGRT